MAKFRKKPVVIDAWPVSELCQAAGRSWDELPKPVAVAYDKGDLIFCPSGIEVKTLEGWMTGNLGDQLIMGVKGELYPCKDEIFKMTYEAV